MIYPTDAVERDNAESEYFKLDSVVILVNETYDWISPKVVDKHHITKKIRGRCEFKNKITSISVPLTVLKSKIDIVISWYILHECAHAIAIKLKNFMSHGKFFHQILIEMMELFIPLEEHDAFIACEATYQKRVIQRWKHWNNWRNQDGNHDEIFPATYPIFRESQGRPIGCN
jgi:hypothetical protein